MASAPGRTLLKRGLHRSVHVEEVHVGGAPVRRVVKCYASASALRRLGDARRARREERRLVELARIGVDVPRVVERRRGAQGWELVTELVEGAVPLAELWAGERPWPVPPERAARELGARAAAALARGLAHRDLHAGNVLIGQGGRPWLVDAAGARVRPPTAERIERALVVLAADARERASPGFRRRFLVAFVRALRAEPASRALAPAGSLRAIASRIELAARARRRAVLASESPKWLRASSAVRELHDARLSGWARRDLAPERIGRALLALDELRRTECAVEGTLDGPHASDAARASERAHGTLASHAARGTRGAIVPIEVADARGARVDVLIVGSRRALRARWLALARLEMHGLPGARPLALLREPRDALLVELPAGATPLAHVARAPDPPRGRARCRIARAIGALAGALHDRGFALALDDVWSAPGAPTELVLLPRAALRVRPIAPHADPAHAAQRACAELADAATYASARERASFAAAHARALGVARHRPARTTRDG